MDFYLFITIPQDSLRQNRMTRFYIQQIEDPHGPSISLFVGNLPSSLSQRQYEKILLDIIGPRTFFYFFLAFLLLFIIFKFCIKFILA